MLSRAVWESSCVSRMQETEGGPWNGVGRQRPEKEKADWNESVSGGHRIPGRVG